MKKIHLRNLSKSRNSCKIPRNMHTLSATTDYLQ
ncbi:MAG: hypothetical protein ACD_87C00134G0001 [uncultured bacterium]|nr:MAG: hypothetical protein ACD_87C00134G0001 [uncultured bacterium]